MAWPIPLYSKKQVSLAGEILSKDSLDFEKWFWADDVLTNWRACHGYPINTFQATLRLKLKAIDPSAIVAQRLKRTPSIVGKLRRIPNMNLSRMQDIGGLRAVVGSIPLLRKLQIEYQLSNFTHQLVREDDYVSSPKPSGYRGVHLVYRYHLASAAAYNGLQVELQFRTRLQHAWATAVETMGTFLDRSLKSSEGPKVWLSFFSICSSAFAFLENCPRIPGVDTLNRSQTFEKTLEEASKLDVTNKLRTYSSAINATKRFRRAAYYLITLDTNKGSVEVEPFNRDQLFEANKRYTDVERKTSNPSIQTVLVSAGSVDSLKRAYPNYFLDTHDFLKYIECLERNSKST